MKIAGLAKSYPLIISCGLYFAFGIFVENALEPQKKPLPPSSIPFMQIYESAKFERYGMKHDLGIKAEYYDAKTPKTIKFFGRENLGLPGRTFESTNDDGFFDKAFTRPGSSCAKCHALAEDREYMRKILT